MRYSSAVSILTDPYRAGLELGEKLKPIAPEVVLLFTSMSFKSQFADLFTGLRDGLEKDNVLIFGGTGDGIYETTKPTDYAACALGMDSGGAVQWAAASEPGVAKDSQAAAKACAQKALAQVGGTADFCMVLADGLHADGTGIVAGVASVLDTPFIGGLTGDDRKFSQSKVFLNQDLEDSVVVLMGRGPIPWSANAANGWLPMGEEGVVEKVEGLVVHKISGMSPKDFMTRQLGKPLGEADLGIIPLAVQGPAGGEAFYLRSPNRIEPDGSLVTFGSMPLGSRVRVCTATITDVLGGVADSVNGAKQAAGFKPAAAIVISCAGRKWLLDDPGNLEVAEFQKTIQDQIPMAGFPSFGEIGPKRGKDGRYTPAFFHNVTFITCLLGA